MTSCPPDCLERHRKNWQAICLALSGVGTSFAAIAGIYLYFSAYAARASDMEKCEREQKELRLEIREELRDIRKKLDEILDARRPGR